LGTVKVADGSTPDITIVPAAGVALSLVEFAVSQQPHKKSEQFEEIWCVFDLDENPPDSFDNAIDKAARTSCLRAAWTNQAFELWYLLHFEYIDTSPARDHGRKRGGKVRDYYTDRLDELVREHLGRKQYDKNDPRLFDDLGPARLRVAIKRANQLGDKWQANEPYHKRCPATTVHLLVQRLLSLAPENIDQPDTRTNH